MSKMGKKEINGYRGYNEEENRETYALCVYFPVIDTFILPADYSAKP